MLRPYQPVGEVKVAKNRVQPANSLQAKCLFSRAMAEGELVAGITAAIAGPQRHRRLYLMTIGPLGSQR